jgi:hypothetical protein
MPSRQQYPQFVYPKIKQIVSIVDEIIINDRSVVF